MKIQGVRLQGTKLIPSGAATTDFTISPPISGASEWTFATDGNLVIATPGEYTLTANKTFSKIVKIWGSGGAAKNAGSPSWGAGGGGGAAVGTISFTAGSTYKIRVSSAGNAGPTPATTYGAGNSGGTYSVGVAGSGGGYSGVFLNSVSQANSVLIAGGGGGGASSRADGLGGRQGLAGGGTEGQAVPGFHAGAGTQSAGGAAAGGSGATSGSALQGGNGGGGGGGGGGGYYGGGGGGIQGDGGYGGGGGSGYSNPLYVTSQTLYTGDQTTAGNSSDPDRPSTVGNGSATGSSSGNGLVLINA